MTGVSRRGAGARRRRCRGVDVAALACAVVAATACDTRPASDRTAFGREYFDSTRTWVHAGVSARTDFEIDPLDRDELAGAADRRTLHLYEVRCGSCHDAPDPRMKTGEHWSFMVPRMQDKTRTAGLLPMTDAEADSIVAFLRRHGLR